MERLTKRNNKGITELNIRCPEGCEYVTCSPEEGYQCQHQCEGDIITKLAVYEDAEEQGLLLRLPCKVGDKLYYIDSYYNVVVPVRLNEVIIQFVGINNYTYQYNCCSFDECGDTYEEYEFNNNDFGKTVFLTKAEAEAKLKEMEGSDD